MADRQALISEFLQAAGWADVPRGVLAADASFRRYDRLRSAARRAVLMDAPPPQEDVRPFLAVQEILAGLGLSAPGILARDIDRGLLLLEDFGDSTYTRLLAAGESEEALYALAIDLLIALHGKFDAGQAASLPAYDEPRLLTEAALLVDWYLPAVSGEKTSPEQREGYLDVWREILPRAREIPDTLVLRDFHVDNLMRLDGRDGIAACGLLDFQDAVLGPSSYDVVSLLRDARRDVPADLATAMIARYLAGFPALDRKAFAASYAILGVQRNCKIVGIFTRLCERDGKPHYLHHIPRLWRMIEEDVRHPALAPIRDWLDDNIPAGLRRIPSIRSQV